MPHSCRPPIDSPGSLDARSFIRQWLCENLFSQLPLSAAVIDRDRYIRDANPTFLQQFGDYSGRHCFEVYKHRSEPCQPCPCAETFRDGKTRLSHEKGLNRSGEPVEYLIHSTPVGHATEETQAPYILQMAIDITPWMQQEKEYRLLYEWVPCTIAVLDRNYRIIRGNRRLHELFGNRMGDHCYEVYKDQSEKCSDCPVEKTFADGQIYQTLQTGRRKDGTVAYYIATSAPLTKRGEEVDQVIELCLDITQERTLETELEKLRAIQESLIENSNRGILAIDQSGKIMILNPELERLLQRKKDEIHSLADLEEHLPPELLQIIRNGVQTCLLPGGPPIRSRNGEEIPIRFSHIRLQLGNETLGYASFFEDLREIKQLEREKLEAERLAVVGQTVAGIAHGVKNIIMGLEGGLYVVKSATRKQDPKLAEEGWRMLENNIMKISALIKDFLNFSKGREPKPQWVDPNQMARDVIALYEEAAKKIGITIVADLQEGIPPAPMDPQGIHSCLANLFSNAIDACRMSSRPECQISLSTREKNGTIIYEVIDNGCGMDYEVKKKVFTTFFSTKGMGGTGLGLLETRKIVQEHGGRIEVESDPGRGSRFSLIFPRNRLPKLETKSEAPFPVFDSATDKE
jgi:PAS domain S-box-containing protein